MSPVFIFPALLCTTRSWVFELLFCTSHRLLRCSWDERSRKGNDCFSPVLMETVCVYKRKIMVLCRIAPWSTQMFLHWPCERWSLAFSTINNYADAKSYTIQSSGRRGLRHRTVNGPEFEVADETDTLRMNRTNLHSTASTRFPSPSWFFFQLTNIYNIFCKP